MTDDTSKQPSDKKVSSTKRRGALKSIGGSAAAVAAAQNLPDSWKKPLVNSIVLPSHAETTDGSGSSGGDNTTAAPTTSTTTPPTTPYTTMHAYTTPRGTSWE